MSTFLDDVLVKTTGQGRSFPDRKRLGRRNLTGTRWEFTRFCSAGPLTVATHSRSKNRTELSTVVSHAPRISWKAPGLCIFAQARRFPMRAPSARLLRQFAINRRPLPDCPIGSRVGTERIRVAGPRMSPEDTYALPKARLTWGRYI